MATGLEAGAGFVEEARGWNPTIPLLLRLFLAGASLLELPTGTPLTHPLAVADSGNKTSQTAVSAVLPGLWRVAAGPTRRA